ncbi:MAG: RNase A-like domain-containing protein [Jatrophihabitantaceae bacterium]
MALDRFELPAAGVAAAQVCLAHRVPAGDPAQLRAAARRSGAFAAELRHSADVLLSSAESSLWRGPAHRAFAEQLRSHAPQLTATADRYSDYSDALFSYAVALDETAAPLHAARRHLQRGAAELASRQRHASLEPVAATPVSQLATGHDPGADLLPIARAFKAGYDRWADALDRCVRALLHADASDPTRDRHGFGAFAHQLGHAAAVAVSPFEQAVLHPSLRNISACLGELNAGLSVLGLGLLFICPAAGAACLAAAAVLAVAQLAVDSTRRAQGEPVSNASLGLGLAAAIPLGGNALRGLRAADGVVHLVPGGGLAVHEAAGGHTLGKHVGKSEEFLRHRLATEPNIRGASTFYDRQVAEIAIHGLLQARSQAVNRWLPQTNAKLILEGRCNEPIGVLITPGSTVATNETGIRVILRRTGVLGGGFYIHTAMVIE